MKHSRFTAAHLFLMDSLCIVVGYPVIQVGLQFFQRLMQLTPKHNQVKLVQHCFRNRLQMPFVCGCRALVWVCSMSLMPMHSSKS